MKDKFRYVVGYLECYVYRNVPLLAGTLPQGRMEILLKYEDTSFQTCYGALRNASRVVSSPKEGWGGGLAYSILGYVLIFIIKAHYRVTL